MSGVVLIQVSKFKDALTKVAETKVRKESHHIRKSA